MIITVFACSLVASPAWVFAESMPDIPLPGARVSVTNGFHPALIRGITVHPADPLRFDFIVDAGGTNLQGSQLTEETQRLIKYFLASLTVPEEQHWVNLSPYEKERIIPEKFGQTEMGRDLLAQDYLLKQLTASLMYPEEELGAAFWRRVYEKAYARYGTTDIPTDTFNKIWVVPDQAAVFEQGLGAVVIKSRLKVMLQEDYLALRKSEKYGGPLEAAGSRPKHAKALHGVTADVVREVLIPEIEKEVNDGRHFALLRQIYHSMILATWYKQNLRQGLLGQVYMDQNKIKGIDLADKTVKNKIYNRYLKAFKKGVFNYIKKDYDAVREEIVARRYFSGGFGFDAVARKLVTKDEISTVTPSELVLFLKAAPRLGTIDDSVIGRVRQRFAGFSGAEQKRILGIMKDERYRTKLNIIEVSLLENPPGPGEDTAMLGNRSYSGLAGLARRQIARYEGRLIKDNGLDLNSLTLFKDPTGKRTMGVLDDSLQKNGMEKPYRDILVSLAMMHGLSHGRALRADRFSNFEMQEALSRYPQWAERLADYIHVKLLKHTYLPGSELFRQTDAQEEEMFKQMTRLLKKEFEETKIIAGISDYRNLGNYLKMAYALVTSNLLSRNYRTNYPPALVFDGDVLPSENKNGLYRVVFVPDISGSFSMVIKTDKVSAGGIRVKMPQDDTVHPNHVFSEDAGLAFGMGSKDIWADIPYLGSKTLTVLSQDAVSRDDVIARMAVSLVNVIGDEGVWPNNIGGPDINSGGHIQKGIDALRDEYKSLLQSEIAYLQDTKKIDIDVIAAKGKASEQKRLALYDLRDPGLKAYHEALRQISEEDGVYFQQDPFMWAMREHMLAAYREGRSFHERLDEPMRKTVDKIIGVAIGGGAHAKGSLVADPRLRFITALGGAQELVETVHHLVQAGRIERGTDVRLAVSGAGAVGGGLVTLLDDFINPQLKAYDLKVKLVAICERGLEHKGAVFKDEGFTPEDEARLASAMQATPEAITQGYLLKEFQDREGFVIQEDRDPKEALLRLLEENDAKVDILFLAAKGPTVTEGNYQRFTSLVSHAIIAGENSAFGEDAETIAKVEALLHQEGVIGLEGYIGNFGTVYAVCSKEGAVKHQYSLEEIQQRWDAILQETKKEVIQLEKELIPVILAEGHRQNRPPGHIQTQIVGELREAVYRLIAKYESRHSEAVKNLNDRIKNIRDGEGQRSWKPFNVALNEAAMQIARRGILSQYQENAEPYAKTDLAMISEGEKGLALEQAEDNNPPLLAALERDIVNAKAGTKPSGPYGGIDLNSALMDLQIERDGDGVPLPLERQPIEQMRIEGFLPVIMNVTPVDHYPFVLSLLEQESSQELSRLEIKQ
jgi:hypothetical protein